MEARTTHLFLVRIGMKRLNRSLVLQAEMISMEASWWKKKFLPTGMKFFLSFHHPPWINDLPLAPLALSRIQSR
jgi:hypothetical protein